MPQKLPTINAEELLSFPLPPTRFIIDGLLPQGLHILAGAPKIGKSWLALTLCLCVAKGEPLWVVRRTAMQRAVPVSGG